MKYRIRAICTMATYQAATGFRDEALKSQDKALEPIAGTGICKKCESKSENVDVDFSFDDEKDAKAMLEALKLKQDNISSGTIKYEKCGHDTKPPLPCVAVEEVKVGITPTEIR